ncbi:MAG: CrcB family protein [Actinobacteria bacterium]|nr:CrcB family protein [Actinomycetota bacterium]
MRHPLSPRAVLLVALGGAVGALARHGLARAFPVGPGTFPTTTFVINVSGAFVLAVLLESLLRRGTPDHWLRLLAGVGILGGFTTFSTMAAELALLWRDGDHALAAVYATATVVAGIAAVVLGLWAAGFRRTPVPDEDEA